MHLRRLCLRAHARHCRYFHPFRVWSTTQVRTLSLAMNEAPKYGVLDQRLCKRGLSHPLKFRYPGLLAVPRYDRTV